MKKKLMSLLSLILVVVMICPTVVFADDTGATIAETDKAFEITIGGKKETSYTIYTNSSKNTVDLDVPAEYTNVGWGSNKPEVAKVDQNGVVTAVSKGTATITVTNYSGVATDLPATITINVVERAISGSVSITKEPTNKTYVSGQYFDPRGMKVEIPWNDGKVEATNIILKENVPLKAGQTSVDLLADGITVTVTGLTVSERTVSSVEVIDAVKSYTVGERIKGISLKVKWNDNSEDTLTSGFEVSIDRALTIDDNNATVTVTYGGKQGTFTITVKAKQTETTPSTPTRDVYTARIINGNYESNYKVGTNVIDLSKVDKIGLFKNNTQIGEISGSILSIKVTFDKVESDKTINVPFAYDADGDNVKEEYTLELKVNVTSATDSTKLSSITSVTMADDSYVVGHEFTTKDIEKLKVKLYKNSSSSSTTTETLYYSELVDYDFFSDVEIEVLDDDGDRKSSSYYRDTIQESDVVTDKDGDKYVNLRVNYKYYTTSGVEKSTSTATFTVKIGEPDIGYYYDGDLIAEYDDLEDALGYCLEDDDNWDNFELRDVDDDEEVVIKLGKDYKIRSNFDDFTPRECNIVIDLNGHNLRFNSDTIVVDRDDKDRTVTITNSSKTEAKFEYYDKGITIVLGEDDKFEFKYDSNAADGYLPGIVTVTATVGKGGKISASPSLSSKGTVDVGMGSDIKFTITPEKDYAVDTIKVNSKTVSTNNNSDYSVSSTGIVTYTLKGVSANTKVEVTFKETKKAWANPFSDVSEKDSYYSAVEFVYTHELFKGTTATKFAPDTTMTRAMFVTVLGRLADVDVSKYKTSSFTDIPLNSTTSWYAPYVQWAVDYGIVDGFPDGTFLPNNEITHQQMYVMMYRYSMFVENNPINVRNVSLSNISDRADIADWASDAVKYGQQKNYLVLSGNRVDPTGKALRRELATLLESFCSTVLNWAD